jgi:hypothetical protein
MMKKILGILLALALFIIFWPLIYIGILFTLLAAILYFVGSILDNIWFKIKWWWTHR